MPLYEYACKKCDHHFDVRHSADEVPELSCPICHHEVRKVFHAAGIIFKGSGWYVTDNAAKAGKDSTLKADAPPAEKSGEASKTPTAPAAEKGTESAAEPVAASKN